MHVAAPARAGAVRGHVQAKQGARTLHRSASIGERPCAGRLWKQRAPRGTSSTTWRRHCSPLLVVAAAEVRRCTCRAVHEACAPKAAARSLATGHSATFAAQHIVDLVAVLSSSALLVSGVLSSGAWWSTERALWTRTEYIYGRYAQGISRTP